MNSDSEQPAFVEKKRRKRLSLKVDENGIADLGVLSDDEKTALMAAMMQDTEMSSAFSPQSQKGPEGGLVSPDDVRRLLGAFTLVEQFLVPRYIKYRTTERNLDGTVKKQGITITPVVAAQAFTFTEGQYDKLCPIGAQAANEHLPEKVKEWIAKTGPGAEFIGLLFLTIHSQINAAIILQKLEDSKLKPAPIPQPENGQATVIAEGRIAS